MKTTRLHMHKWSAIFVILLVLIVSSHTNLAAQTWPNGSTGQLVDGCKQNDGVWAGYCIGHEIQVLTANAGMGQFGKGNSAHGIDGAPKQTGNGFYIENRMGNGVSGHDRDRP